MSIYDPPIKPRKPAPAVSPAVSYVRPTGPAPQGKFGSPSAMGFSPAYTSSVPKSEPSIWSQALTKVGGQAAASFLQSPSKPVQQLAYNSTIGSLASPEFLMNNNLSPLRGMDPNFKPTWQEAIQAPLDAAGFMAAPMFTLGLAGADAAGVKNITGNTLLGTGAIVTAVNVWKNKGNPAAAVKALGPMVNALGFGSVANWVQENTGVNIHGLGPWFLQKANTLGPYPEKPWPRQEYWQDATKKLTDTNTPIVNPYADPPWERGGYRFEPVNRSKGRVKTGGDAQGNGVFEDFDFQTGKWIERVPRPTWMQQFMQNFRNAINPNWKTENPKQPLQLTNNLTGSIPYGHNRIVKDGITKDVVWNEANQYITPPNMLGTMPPWEALKRTMNQDDLPNQPFDGDLGLQNFDQQAIDAFWKAVKENPGADPYKIWDNLPDAKPYGTEDEGDGDPYTDRYGKRWDSLKEWNRSMDDEALQEETKAAEEEFWRDPAAFMEANREPEGSIAYMTEEEYAAWLESITKPKLDIPKEIKNRDDWTEIDPESIPPWEVLKNSPERDFTDQVFLGNFWKIVRENPTLDPYKIWEVMSDDKNGTLNNKPFPLVDPDDGLPVAEDYTKEQWESYKKSLAVNPNLKLPLPSEEEISRYWASEGYFKEPDDELYAEKMQRWLNYQLLPGEEDEYVRFMFNRDYDPNAGSPRENMSLQEWKNSVANEDGENNEPDTYIDPLGNEWDSKDQWDAHQQSMQEYAARQALGPMQESIEESTNRLAARMAEGGERPVSYYQELLRQSYKTFEDLANAGTDFNRFPTDVTPKKWIEDNNTFLPSMMGTHHLFNNPKYSSGLGAGTNRNTDFTPWDSKPRPPYYFDEYGNFVENNPLRSMGNETLKSLPMGQLGVSAQIQLRRDIFMGADLDKLPEPTKKAIYESFDMGWHPGLGDDEEDNSRMGDIFESITGFPQPESNVGDGEYDTGNYMVEGYPLMNYINSPESGLPNLGDYLVPTGQDAEGRMTFEGDYYKWEQDFREAWRDNPGLFRDRKLHPEFLPEWANPRYRDNSGE